jgi:hypothetical protein
VNDDIRRRALDAALTARKHEIDLFWTRSLFFWGFIAVAAASYGILATANNQSPEVSFLKTVVASFGVVCSAAWVLVNRGSKFWQDSWEKNVGSLEQLELGGPYFTKARSDVVTSLESGGRFSVTKVTILLSWITTALWTSTWFLTISTFNRETLLITPFAAAAGPVGVVVLIAAGRNRVGNWDGPS